MARRFGWATCVIGLHLCALAGCLHTDAPRIAPGGPFNPPPAGPVATPVAYSPYTTRATDLADNGRPPPALPKLPVDAEVKRASQSPTPAEPPVTRPAQPLPLAPLPAPERLPGETVSTQAAKTVPESPLVAALRFVLGKKPAEAFDALHGYDKQTQEILLALLPVAARLGEGGLDHAPPEEIAALLEQLDHLANLLRGRAALTVEKGCFARRIEGFGAYDPLPADPVFTAGSDGQHGDRAQVYAEVRNAQSKFDGKVHTIQLTGRLEVHGTDGQCLWSHNYREGVGPTRSLSPRQDVVVNFQFRPPPNLRPGNYVLVVEVRDEMAAAPDAAPRVARCKLPFRVGDPVPARAGEK